MEELIFKYLDSNYVFSLSTIISYKLVDKFNKTDIGVLNVMNTLKNVFDVDDDELYPIWEKWSQIKAVEINNKITDFRYKIYEATGYNVELTLEDMNKILNEKQDDVFESTLYDYSTPKAGLITTHGKSKTRN